MDGIQIIFASRARFEMQSRGIGLTARISVIRQPGQVLPSRRRREIRQSLPGATGRLQLRVVVKHAPMACYFVRRRIDRGLLFLLLLRRSPIVAGTGL